MKGISSYKLINNVLGWLVFGIALIVYSMTMERTGSFWDCGEFIAGAYKLQVVHPPGAPIFNIIGRIFSMFSFGNPQLVGMMVNFLSALSTAFVVLFCFWSTTALARKFVMTDDEEYSTANIFGIMAGGIVAGLSCLFLDSLWFSATEGEVYALSMFFMTFVVWAILKWDADDTEYADRWLLLIAFMIGLSTGVHLLSMLVIPFACLIYYFKRHEFSVIGLLVATASSFVIIGFIMKGIISGIPWIYAKADLFFVNGIGMGFNTGVIVSSVIMVAMMAGAIFITNNHAQRNIQKILLGVTFLVIGYSSFIIVPIRSTANTPINMNRPTEPFSMLSYLNREQYGARPLLFGPAYPADQYDLKREGGVAVKSGVKPKYVKGKESYEKVGEKFEYVFEKDSEMFFPRLGVWQDPAKVDAYRAWIQPEYDIYDRETKSVIGHYKNNQLPNAEQYVKEANNQNTSSSGSNRYVIKDDVDWGDNIGYFFEYQIGYMYMRYFMWNFSGRQNDIQGKYDNDEGGWITGIGFLDDHLTVWGNPKASLSNLSPQRSANKSYNKFYGIPFVLGLIGIFFLFKQNWKLGIAVMLMFLTTGVFFIIYGNQPPIEPRERDYTLVGSFFVFCIWIGMAVIGLYKVLSGVNKGTPAAFIALAVGIIAPILMGSAGWDDHNRSGRTTTIDFATNYLESCAPNAIIFTQGDNDTYPLWYAQEVEGVRTDIRVVNISLIGVDWYIDQLRYKMNDADPVKLTFTSEDVRASNRDYVQYVKSPKLNESTYYDAQQIMKFVAKDDDAVKAQVGLPYYLPTKKLKFTVDESAAIAMNMLPDDTTKVFAPEMYVNLKKSTLMKGDLMTVDIIANNINERPIYFAVSVSPSAYLGFEKYFMQEGLTYRVVPMENKGGSPMNSPVNTDVMFENVTTKFKYGQIAENPDILIDENISRMTMNLISNYSKLSKQLLKEGKKEKAVESLDFCMQVLPKEKIPYNYFHADFPKVYIQTGNEDKAKAMAADMMSNAEGELDYYVELFNKEVEWAKENSPTYLQELAQGRYQSTNRGIQEQLYLIQAMGKHFEKVDPELSKQYKEKLGAYSAAFQKVN